jgi:hypothetical protein
MSLSQKDMHHNLKIGVGIESQLIDSDDDFDGEILDVQGFESLEVAFQTGELADGDFDCLLFESDDDGMAGATEVDAADLIGSAPSFDDSESNTVKSVGYKGSKRFVRPRVTSSNTTDGGIVGALALQGSARNAPVV